MNKKEALAALAAGKKVRSTTWPAGHYLQVTQGGNIVLMESTTSGQETAAEFAWNTARGYQWGVVTDEREELTDAISAVKDARGCYKVPFDSILFAKIERYLNRRARELGLQVSE